MLLLSETPAGYGLFRLTNKKLLKMDAEQVAEEFQSAENAQKALSLVAFSKFKDTKTAMEEATALIESKMGKQLKKFLKKSIVAEELSEKLAVIDKALGSAIQKKFNIECVHTETVRELMRGLRFQMEELVEGLDPKETRQMALGLAHTMSRFKLKFSPDKVDTMIIQAVGLLDDLDKELNNFAMRLREWYGWHFPELAKIVSDNLTYAKVVKLVGMRSQCKNVDFEPLSLPDEVVSELKQAAEVSFGTEVTVEDLENIMTLCDRVIELMEYRTNLAKYLQVRMAAIAPNLTYMVGELIGARLISHAGSLINLAKHPSSTVQILGAEKALFRALKMKAATPKYGLLYHASLVGQSAPKLKGKMSRVLAAKLSLAIRCDSLGDDTEPTVGKQFKEYVEKRLCAMEDAAAGGKKGMKKSDVKSFKPKESKTRDAGDDAPDASAAKAMKSKRSASQEPSSPMKRSRAPSAEPSSPMKKKVKADAASAPSSPMKRKAGSEPSSPMKKKVQAGAGSGEGSEKKKKKKKKAPVEDDE
eukprot:GEMP01023139.1.p1 GENE.GEMP01023139.1~~GEMP01023139.1.p1  ORF type:complete len:531 (+),score=152.68 GEMP01023139.1:60-1652(+)